MSIPHDLTDEEKRHEKSVLEILVELADKRKTHTIRLDDLMQELSIRRIHLTRTSILRILLVNRVDLG